MTEMMRLVVGRLVRTLDVTGAKSLRKRLARGLRHGYCDGCDLGNKIRERPVIDTSIESSLINTLNFEEQSTLSNLAVVGCRCRGVRPLIAQSKLPAKDILEAELGLCSADMLGSLLFEQ